MMACPLCAGATQVTETREAASGIRRRRRCLRDGCTGKLTTLEVVAHGTDFRAGGMVLVPIAKLRQIAALIGGVIPSPEQTSCVSPED